MNPDKRLIAAAAIVVIQMTVIIALVMMAVSASERRTLTVDQCDRIIGTTIPAFGGK